MEMARWWGICERLRWQWCDRQSRCHGDSGQQQRRRLWFLYFDQLFQDADGDGAYNTTDCDDNDRLPIRAQQRMKPLVSCVWQISMVMAMVKPILQPPMRFPVRTAMMPCFIYPGATEIEDGLDNDCNNSDDISSSGTDLIMTGMMILLIVMTSMRTLIQARLRMNRSDPVYDGCRRYGGMIIHLFCCWSRNRLWWCKLGTYPEAKKFQMVSTTIVMVCW